ncbi:hypothetical protein P8452_57571 [Trifolium repens]|nr:hypothetical protein P8452_57571 [Trifolium repens]
MLLYRDIPNLLQLVLQPRCFSVLCSFLVSSAHLFVSLINLVPLLLYFFHLIHSPNNSLQEILVGKFQESKCSVSSRYRSSSHHKLRNVHLGLCSGYSTMMGLGPKVTNETLCSSFAYKNVSIKCCSSLWSNYIQRNSLPLLNFSKHKDSRIFYVAALCILVLLLQGCDG